MNLSKAELLKGEKILLSKNSNAIIRVSDHGLNEAKYASALSLIGMKGKEAIGGRLHLTNYRLVFKSHRFNRVSGSFTIFLCSILDVSNTSFLLTRKIKVTTSTRSHEFILWGADPVIRQIRKAQAEFPSQSIHAIRQQSLSRPAVLGKFGPSLTGVAMTSLLDILIGLGDSPREGSWNPLSVAALEEFPH